MEAFDWIEENLANIEPVRDEPEQEEEQSWMDQRVGKFTSSRLGDLMTEGRGKDKFWGDTAMSYIYEKIAELITGIPHFKAESASLAWGNDNEAAAIEAYRAHTGNEVHHMGEVFIKFNELCGGSPDAYVGDDGIAEAKCPYNSANHIKTFITREIPKPHIFQCQGNMLFSNRQWCDYISYDPRMPEGMQLVIIRMPRNEKICDSVLKRIDLAVDEIVKIEKLTGIKILKQ